MGFHISGKLCAIGFVIASLVTAFNTSPLERTVPLGLEPTVHILPVPYVTPETFRFAQPYGPDPNPSFVLRATGYNSLVGQTNAQPFITATGARTRFGIIAVSRDLLTRDIPYGSLVRIRDLGGYHNGRGHGKYQPLLDAQGLFIVEDTLHQRKHGQIDIWFEHLHEAREWGVRKVELEVVRYGRHGPTLDLATQLPAATMTPQLSAVSQARTQGSAVRK